MNYAEIAKIAKDIIIQTLTEGEITLVSGEKRVAKTSEILATAKYVVKEALLEERVAEDELASLPDEMFYPGQREEYVSGFYGEKEADMDASES